ncbi:hypothetical protein X801_07900, partial [Opisthorchis viverrini]
GRFDILVQASLLDGCTILPVRTNSSSYCGVCLDTFCPDSACTEADNRYPRFMSTASDSVDSPKLVLTEEPNSPPSGDQPDWRVKAFSQEQSGRLTKSRAGHLYVLPRRRCSRFMSTASDSVDSPKLVLTEEPNSPPSGDQPDWRVKACELLETHIEMLKQSNIELAMKSAAISCCLVEVLGDLSFLSRSASESEDKNWLVKQLGHVMQTHSVNASELFSESCPPVTPSTDHSIISDSSTPAEPSTAPAAKRTKPEAVRQHKRRKTHHEPK